MIRRPDDKPVLVPDPPRAIPGWFFLRRMRGMAFGGLLFTILGAALGCGLPVFFYVLGGYVWPTVDLALDREHASATAAITDKQCIRHTNVNSRHPWKIAFQFTTPGGTTVDAVGYTFDPSFADRQAGDAIEVEYAPADPWQARPVGGTAALMPLSVYLLILATLGPELIIGLVLLALTWVRARNERVLLAFGPGTGAEVIDVRRVSYIRFGSRHPHDVYYRFAGSLGREVTGRDRTYHYAWAEALKPGDTVGVVYHPELPEANVLWLHGKDAPSGA